MPRTDTAISGYRPVWLFAMFDLPVKTRADRRSYTRFRSSLLDQGFCMLQYSVYARYCPSEEASVAHRRHVEAILPDAGQVRLVAITDRQFEKMQVFYGRNRKRVEDPPAQLMLF